MLKLNLKLEKEDHVQYQLYTASKSERIKKKRKAVKIRLPIVYIILAFLLAYIGHITLSISFVIIAMLWYFLYPLYERKKYVKHYQSHVDESFKGKLDLESVIELDDEEIRTSDEMGNSTIKVEKINAIGETGRYIYIYLTPGMGLVIPKQKVEQLAQLKEWIIKQTAKGVPYNLDLNWSWK
ncbi:MAG: YcxB family protein [Carboxylicivirga sp.]|jgi:prepilin signal peptidase PulO-like enzyme (type II secretory pathway)|nr:YcxB family protein [Carboxylicivirga sp.]